MIWRLWVIATFLLASCEYNAKENRVIENVTGLDTVRVHEMINDEGELVSTRFNTPSGYERSSVLDSSFHKYLRTLPLKPNGADVKYYNGSLKVNYDVYEAVVDLGIGSKNLHQCADAVMRLRAEYLWKYKKYDDIHFDFTNGFRVDYNEWMKGRRMIVQGNKTHWDNRDHPSNTYEDFWDYLELVFMYAGTASLEKELKSVSIDEVEIGDVLIQGGFPGHAVIIVDKAIHEQSGKSLYILAQSYMPAQEIQILHNLNDSSISPWYELNHDTIITPEWVFYSSNLKRFH